MLKSQLRLYRILALTALVVIIPLRVIAIEDFLSTTVSVTASTVFSMGFYIDQNVIYSTTVPFSNVDPQESMVYPNGRAENDGKSDTGVVCIANIGDPWYLQIWLWWRQTFCAILYTTIPAVIRSLLRMISR